MFKLYEIMKLTNLTIKDLISPDAKLTFLVGAGCSIDPPSCLPDGKTMMEALINYTCTESEIPKIKKIKELRFEELIGILRARLDPELRIIDFYGLCDTPNLQHFFLAEMMKQGQFVLTTNFDFLIEYALQKSGVPKKNIIPVITREDFQKNKDPKKLFKKGKKALYKIHGSTRNVINDNSTRDSLIATMEAFGANKEGENVFQLESFKQPAFVNLTKGRSLVVLGYSGSDDFDIVPTLKVLEQIKDIIWINYIPDDDGQEEIYEITKEEISHDQNLKKVDQILADIKRMNYAKRVFRVDINTTRMIRDLISTQVSTNSDAFTVDAYEWLSQNIEPPNNFLLLSVPYQIYLAFNLYEDALRLLKKIVSLSEKNKDLKWKCIAYNNMGFIYDHQGHYQKALEYYDVSLQICEQLGNQKGKATLLNNIGNIYFSQGEVPEAFEKYKEALQIAEQLGEIGKKAIYLSNIGQIHRKQGNYSLALKCYKESLKIQKQEGNLGGTAIGISNIGVIYDAQGNRTKALKCYEETLRIFEELGALAAKGTCLYNIGGIYEDQRDYPEALNRYEQALHIYDQIGSLMNKAFYLRKIGGIYTIQKNYFGALEKFKEALHIYEELGELQEKARILGSIGMIYYTQKDYPKALKRFEESLDIFTRMGVGDSLFIYTLKNHIQAAKKQIESDL